MQLAEHGVLRAPQREEGTVEHLNFAWVLVDAVVLGVMGTSQEDSTDLVIGGGERCVIDGLLVIGEFSTVTLDDGQAPCRRVGIPGCMPAEVEAGSDRLPTGASQCCDGGQAVLGLHPFSRKREARLCPGEEV